MKRDLRLYLEDILESCRFIQEFVHGMDFEAFVGDEKTTSAVIRKFEVMGEAAKNIPEQIRVEYPNVPWQKMASMRDRLIHAYFGVDYQLVWDTIQQFIPSLIETIADILNDVNKGNDK
ncbi:MAG: DUF86 domain-containing protein [Candidatus Marinimicrobia bacterium]|nr:DUF86 domain-containing protein [Candidatus Neomarinimicrobiota bacterium]